MATPLEVLRAATFGSRTAEDERDQLKQYFVKTEQWANVISGDIDIVYGSKGSGKSAIYSLVFSSQDELFDRRILVIAAENPQGAPAFRDIISEPPKSQSEFVSLWKLYFLCVAAKQIKEYGYTSDNAASLLSKLEEAELLPRTFSLSRVLRFVTDYIRRVSSVESTLHFDTNTGMPTGVTGKIALQEPTTAQVKLGVVSVDELFDIANNALKDIGYTLWICIDRLDVAFADQADLEADALRALFKCYLDIHHHDHISLKIFLRSDIWEQISSGLREASHIERSLTISWNEDNLMNLAIRRILSNQLVCDFYKVDREDILSKFNLQRDFLQKIFPQQVESGGNKPQTFKWILGRTQDATQTTAPRELIHFMNELRDVQIKRLEMNMPDPSEKRLFDQAAFKEALPAVSKTRIELTIYAEFPNLKPYIMKLQKQKAEQTTENLAALWGISAHEAQAVASELAGVGFFREIGGAPHKSWWVPFLYRPALELVQGSSE